jgi:hypothetical protein
MDTRVNPNHGPDGKFAASAASAASASAKAHALTDEAKAMSAKNPQSSADIKAALQKNMEAEKAHKEAYDAQKSHYQSIKDTGSKAEKTVAKASGAVHKEAQQTHSDQKWSLLQQHETAKKEGRTNAKHKDDGTFDHTPGNKAHAKNLAKCANVLSTMKPKTKQQVTSIADTLYGKIQQPFDANTVLGVAIASMPKPVGTHMVLAAGALGYLAQKNNAPS